ncbi:peptidylprolyl isomerase [Candidatus Protofrankia datiscae]|uniref:Peptidyl-prolyl cis-trans isomerase cyclophilin type n=1 Tax=Candidatus Protofrankia datiscae TaxID=2716812 RepID=F8B2A5_9ACTN|nr:MULTISPECIES: peptidylprolyl isomerase [Protofrankia]AEH09903.1 peptidyl-prolyl cis-trans isomerase cyclophilin type [Candidatus Protofrankia datiscae]
MVTSKTRRQRDLAAARAARQAARRAASRRRQRRVTAAVCVGALILLTGGITAALLVTGDDDTASLSPSATSPATEPSAAAPAVTTQVGPCTYTSDGQKPSRPLSLPAAADTVDRSPATMTINTNKGTIRAALDAEKAPCTVHALLTMANAKYFDNTTCHRETTQNIFVLQCGDPDGTGMGGPGFAYANENTDGARYTRGVIAMANAGPGTNGSQFFINYQDPNEDGVQALATNYTVVGKVTEGLSVLAALTTPGVEGGAPDGAPASKPQTLTLTITQGT